MSGVPALESKLVVFAELSSLGEKLRAEGKTVVTTNGCFDLLHLGHIQYLWDARNLGDVLICGVNSDTSVKTLKKGPDRPIQSENTRAKQLAGLVCVDYVVVFEQSTPIEFLSAVRPKIHVKGADYKGKELPEGKVLESFGGSIELVPLLDGFSTSLLINHIRQSKF